MATSGTTTFDLNIDDIIQEAYERCGVRTNSGYDLKSARRSSFMEGRIKRTITYCWYFYI